MVTDVPSNPIQWTPQELGKWLETYENGRFQVFQVQLRNFRGKELYAFSNSQWGNLEPIQLAKSLRYTFMGICAIQSAMEPQTTRTLSTILSEDTTALDLEEFDLEPKKKIQPVAFPAIIATPKLWFLFLLFLLALAFVLCITVWKQQLAQYGITTEAILRFGSIPVISLLFTYFHIWLALYMTFYPLEFVGCCQIPGTNVGLGWQGIIAHKGEAMARKAVRMMTTQLMDVKEIFSRIDPDHVATELEPILHGTIADIIDTMANKYNPTLWRLLPTSIKEEIVEKVQEESPSHIADLMMTIRENIEEVFDIEEMVVTNMMKDKQLLVNMFLTCGYSELCFIRNSGAWWGGIFGLIQMVVWFFYTNRIVVFPAFGLVVGTITNWLALKLIFEPVNPKKICCFTLHGLFLRRQHQVAAEYGRMVASDVLNSKNIIESILKGPASDKLFELIYKNVKQAVDSGASITEKLVEFSIGRETYANIKDDICDLIVEKFPDSMRHIESYATKAMDLEVTLRDKMRQLSYEDFEGLLHPVFQEDEWKLVLMGGILGFLIGLFQAFGINS